MFADYDRELARIDLSKVRIVWVVVVEVVEVCEVIQALNLCFLRTGTAIVLVREMAAAPELTPERVHLGSVRVDVALETRL